MFVCNDMALLYNVDCLSFSLIYIPCGGLSPWGAIINLYLTYQRLLGKYDEISYFVFFPWSKYFYFCITKIVNGGNVSTSSHTPLTWSSQKYLLKSFQVFYYIVKWAPPDDHAWAVLRSRRNKQVQHCKKNSWYAPRDL